MNTSEITPQQVAEWMKAKLAELQVMCPDLKTISIVHHYTYKEPLWTLNAPGVGGLVDASLRKAVEEMMESFAPAKSATKKRADAARLLAEAEALEASAK